MPLQKSSLAEHRSVRLNPINPEEAQVLKILDEYRRAGYEFKQVLVSAILKFHGDKPHLFDHVVETEALLQRMNELLTNHIETVLEEIRRAGYKITARNGDDEDITPEQSPLARNLARGIMQRREQRS